MGNIPLSKYIKIIFYILLSTLAISAYGEAGDPVIEGKTVGTKLEYTAHPSITAATDIIDKKYADDTFLTTESDPLALKTAGTDNVKDTHIDWGIGATQVSADDIPDGSTNAIITLTQETNFGTAYTHSQTDTGNPHSLDYADIGLGANQVIDWTADQGATNIHAGNYTDTNTTYTASGTLLNLTGTAFSVNEGTLTNGKYCTYVTGTGLVCNSDSGAMTYPGAGIALSTGSAWGTSITNNSANWNTAYGWGNHASVGYLTSTSTGVTGDWTINSDLGDVTSKLIFGRTTGGNGEISYNGTNWLFQRVPGNIATLAIQGGANSISAIDEISSQFDFYQHDGSITNGLAGRIASISEFANGAYAGLAFYTAKQGRSPELAEAMRINYEGQVGIGTASFISTEKLRVNGNQYIDGTLNIAGGQIVFPATQSASSNANTLDDYEEGTWTPTVTCSTSGGFTIDSDFDTAAYIKIGKKVHVQGMLQIGTDNSCSGNLQFSLPFTSADLSENADFSQGTAALVGHGSASLPYVQAVVYGGLSFMQLVQVTENGSYMFIDNVDVDGAWQLYFSLDYIAAN